MPRFSEILVDRQLARFGDSLLNFALSLALTKTTGHPTGVRVKDTTLANAAVKAGLRARLPKRVDRGDVANSLEALVGYAWINDSVSLDEIVGLLSTPDLALDQEDGFARLGVLLVSRLHLE